jgi:hypothetical protein
MKLKFNCLGICAVISAFIFIISGCKPKEQVIANQVVKSQDALLTGQIFIVTKSRQNIVLGDQKIDLLDAGEVRTYFNSKVIEWSNSLEAAQAKVSQATSNVNLAQTNLDLLYKSDLDKYTAAKKYHDNIITTAPSDSQEWSDALAWSQKMDENIKQINELKKKSDEQKKLDDAQSLLDTALAEQERVWNDINWPSPDYFTPEIKNSTTDSEGRFKFIVPSSYENADLILFAKADRLVGDENENYWWMVNVHLNGKTTDVVLSNDNKDSSGVWGWFSDDSPFEKYMLNYSVTTELTKKQQEFEAWKKSLESK